MIVPQNVIDHCNKFKLCKGCKLNCVAPVGDHNFNDWLNGQIIKVQNYETKKRNDEAPT